jgi:glutamate/aspartate transport system permease protein
MNYDWNWWLFFEMVADTDATWFDMLMSGLGWTLLTSACAWLLAFFLGSLMGIARSSRHQGLILLGNAFVELFRNIPLIVQFFIWYFVLPEVIAPLKQLSLSVDPTQFQFMVSVACLGLFTAARVAEQVRSGILSIPLGQYRAGQALGLGSLQIYRFVLLPMAYRTMLPPMTSEMMSLIKNTSVALTIGLTELTFRAREMGEFTFSFFEAYIAATLTYIVVALAVSRLMNRLESLLAVPGFLGASK